jgi:propionyl-CoA synthetase
MTRSRSSRPPRLLSLHPPLPAPPFLVLLPSLAFLLAFTTNSSPAIRTALRCRHCPTPRCDPPTAAWIGAALGVPVIDHWWQTETGSPICGFLDQEIGSVGGSTAMPLPGYDVHAVDANTSALLPYGELGDLALRLPLPPGALVGLWQAEDRFVQAYLARHPGW